MPQAKEAGIGHTGPLGVRRPRLVLAAAVVTLAVLAIVGFGVEKKLGPGSLRVPGTEAARGDDLLQAHFGDSAPFAVLLEGPAAALRLQGARLAAALRTERGVRVLSPWHTGPGLGRLQPNPRRALILVDFRVPLDVAVRETVPRLEGMLETQVRPPVTARSAGYASVARAIQDESIAIAKRGELIVAPLLLIVLLIVFRSPLAAAIPLVFGATTVIGSRGLIAIAANYVDVSGLALSVASMIGLALGVDYALLIVSRFREELAGGATPAAAATATRATAGRTTLFAASTLLVAMAVGVLLVPGSLLVSLCTTVVAVVALAAAGPWIVGPAILVVLGEQIDRWRIRGSDPARTRWLTFSRVALRRPELAVALSCILLFVVAAPAVSLATGPVTIEQLPPDNGTRLDVEAIETAVGGGWISPSVVVAESEAGPITAPRRLAALQSWQTRAARLPGVDAVIGPGTLAARVAPLRRAGQRLLDPSQAAGSGAAPQNLAAARRGLTALRRGLGKATEGAALLATGSSRAEAGAGLLARGLTLAASGGKAARGALRRFERGAHRLAGGQQGALLGVSLVAFGGNELNHEVAAQALPEARRLARRLRAAASAYPVTSRAAAQTLERLEAAWSDATAMTTGTADPRYPALQAELREALTAAAGSDPVDGSPYAPGYDGLASQLADTTGLLAAREAEARRLRARLIGVAESVRLMHRIASRLRAGTRRLSQGSTQLAAGSDRIVAGAGRLTTELARMRAGAERLTGGLARLEAGNLRLEHGLSAGFHRSEPLERGARQVERLVASRRRQFQRRSPRFFDSGYFVLSVLEGAPPQQLELAGEAIDLARGGQAARVLVISDAGLGDPETVTLNDRLRRQGDQLASRLGAKVAVTGGVAQVTDYARATTNRLPALVLAISLVTLVAMVVILRAVPLAVLAVILNLCTVAAAFGVLRLLLLAPDALPFGGSDHIDPVGAAGTFGVVFGLSIDYAVFLLMRIRESWDRDHDHGAAIAYGLERTAGVISGAATVMVVVFCAFAFAPIVSVAQFGVGLAVAVALDATVIRLLLLPALMKLAGPRIWWFPAALSRRPGTS